MMSTFTHKAIPSRPHRRLLPPGFSLVLEGGGTRCCYTGGVLDAFLDAGILFPYVVGVSAGAGNALSYLSGQLGRNKVIALHHVVEKEYMSLGNLLRQGSFINMDYLARVVPEQHSFFDWEAFHQAPAQLMTGALNCLTGENIWFSKEELGQGEKMLPIVASCSLPFLCPMVDYQGTPLLDGGAREAIPIHKSVEDGNQFHVVILTKEAGYRKKPQYTRLARTFYKDHDPVREVLETRHQIYNQQLELCEALEAEGKALLIRPKEPVKMGRTERSREKLEALYQAGEAEGADYVACLQEILPKEV